MLAYLRTITITLLTLLAISSVTLAPAMAAQTHEIDWGDGSLDSFSWGG